MCSKLYYLMNYFYKKRLTLFAFIIMKMIRIIYSCEIHYKTNIGKNLKLPHNGLGCVISHNAIIGDNCNIMQNVTIGGRGTEGVPKIGDNVLIGAGAIVLGNINIGNNVKIGANSVVLNDLPDNCTAVGIPAQIKKM